MSNFRFRYEFPTIVGIAMDKPIIVVESASPTPFDIVSGLGIESSVENCD
ncbi:MAG: hypothetical protein ACLUKN_07445 [Bacilli bacterium]